LETVLPQTDIGKTLKSLDPLEQSAWEATREANPQLYEETLTSYTNIKKEIEEFFRDDVDFANLLKKESSLNNLPKLAPNHFETDTFYFTSIKDTPNYKEFKEIDNTFVPKLGAKIILVDKNNPENTYEFIFGKNLFKSQFRNEFYYKLSNPFENSQLIRDAIKEAFPTSKFKWQLENEEMSEGLRNVYTFSEEDNWSVLNYFDTNPQRQKKLFELFKKSGENDPKEWIVNFFKTPSEELNNMVRLQRNSIKRADKSEIDAMSLISDNFTASQTKGSKLDRYSSIDATDNNTSETYQIKQVESVEEFINKETGEITWEIKGNYSRLVNYGNKKELNNIAYYIPEKNVVYVFKNENYNVKNSNLATHNLPPKVYSK
jgi:hypothetical protein